MKTLKEYFKESKKELIYAYYSRVLKKPKAYEEITREKMYDELIAAFKEEPDIITHLGTVEEVNILKNLLEEELSHKENGYLEYILLENLTSNNLVFKDADAYYIPKDLINPVKMAINIYNEEEYMYQDITDSIIIGLIRVLNVATIPEFITYLKEYNIVMTDKSLKEYLKTNARLNKYISIVKYKKENYVISLENNCYKDILALKTTFNLKPSYSLEEIISVGKYKINLFKEPIFNFLSFLEAHLKPKYIELILNEIIVYAGFDLNNDDILLAISDNIPELYQKIKEITPYFPCWIYLGNTIEDLEKINKTKKEKPKKSS